jgi:hypothetical protein
MKFRATRHHFAGWRTADSNTWAPVPESGADDEAPTRFSHPFCLLD